ncbi:type VII secretion-associated serine protease mycosin [Actinocatenispora sera]|uniref:type VII secretion-associated serine protease mycosin n=1 Tax=Actinocatenispora sera TaxID=390989 RepID=UPI00068DB18E|nr:type VII secretion-associated serine protease mycosin [Actinocatenispora sera]
MHRVHRPRRVVAALGALATGTALALLPAAPASAGIHGQEWFLDTLHIGQAHRYSTGKGVTVAVVDSGIDAGHPDLKGHVRKGVDLTGYSDKYGWGDDSGHGTAMAGIIAAQGGGEDHAYGIAPGADILPVQVGSDPPIERLANAIRWSVDHHAQVINISMGINRRDYSVLTAAVRYALDHNVVVIAAAGNLHNSPVRIQLPAKVPGVVAVTGTTRSGSFWDQSSHSKPAALAAPADGITSTDSRTKFKTGYSTGYGTSASAAIVSGVAALVRAKYPDLDAANLINRLTATADDKGPKGRDSRYGYGIVDPVRALTAKVPHVDRNPVGTPAAKSHRATRRASEPSETTPVGLYVGIVVAMLVVVALLTALLVVRGRRARRRRA